MLAKGFLKKNNKTIEYQSFLEDFTAQHSIPAKYWKSLRSSFKHFNSIYSRSNSNMYVYITTHVLSAGICTSHYLCHHSCVFIKTWLSKTNNPADTGH